MMNLIVGQPLPKLNDWSVQLREMQYWRGSYIGGSRYVDLTDARGNKILEKYPNEQIDIYQARLKRADQHLFNYVNPIIDRYNDIVFQNKPDRSVNDHIKPIYENIDGFGTDIDSFMKLALVDAQIDGRSFILVESSEPIFPGMTQYDVQIRGIRPVWKHIPAVAVPYYKMNGQQITYAIIRSDEDNAYEYTNKTIRHIKIKGEMMTDISDPVPHNMGGMPLVILQPYRYESQAADIANLQKGIFNIASLLFEELFSSTYSWWAFLGIGADEVKKAVVGPASVLAIDRDGVQIQRMSADVSQAASIRETIKMQIGELYRTAGITTGNALDAGPTLSGVALAFLGEGMNSHANALSKAVQLSENKAMSMTVAGAEPIQYSTEYFPPSIAEDIKQVIDAVDSQMPATIKAAIVKEFASQHLTLTEEQLSELDSELGLDGIEDEDEDEDEEHTVSIIHQDD